ncbi:MAG: KOW domain-containing RNA-binding protein [Synergistaceae bacterium]|nr:KOW domain-containing RNA-binding protein [Synergistaceae bacterium]
MADLKLGQVVISKQGKDVGRIYVVVGVAEGRVFLADACKFNVKRPKRKNPKHLQPMRLVIDEVRKKVEEGQDIDHGRFRYLLSAMKNGGREK